MADTHTSSAAASGRTSITLHVVSPSSPRITFENISIATTVLELKTKISETASTHPQVGTQRLIYRGHPVVQGERTLRDIFGQQTIDQSDSLTLHLVTPPSHQASITSQQPHLRSAHTPQHQSPLRSSSPVGNSQGFQSQNFPAQAPSGHSNAGVNVGQPVLPQGQLPPQLQQSFIQFQAIQAQLAAQLASLHNHPTFNVQLPQHQPQTAQANIPLSSAPNRTSSPNHQQHTTGSAFSAQSGNPQQNHGGINTNANGLAPPHTIGMPVMPNSNTVIREHIGPNGQRWATVTHTGTINVNHPLQTNQRPGTAQSESANSSNQSLGSGVANNQSMPTSTAPTNPNTTQTPTNPTTSTSNIPQSSQDRPATQHETNSADASAVYILSSPSGPQALLVSPSGRYTAPWPFTATPAAVHYPTTSPFVPSPFNTFNVVGSSNVRSPQPQPPTQSQPLNMQQRHPQQTHQFQSAQLHNQAVAGNQAVMNPRRQQQQQQRQDQARDLARIMLPLAGHLWLFVRLFGFVWFFTHGASWTRTILLCLIATLVFIGQSGMFRPFFQEVWGPIRRHAENLFPVAGNGRPNAPAAQVDGRDPSAPGQTREPNPQDNAERLLGQRREQDANFIRAILRRIERAVALFVASLAPGVAERHIQARQAAEARERELRESAKSEEERQKVEKVEEAAEMPQEGNAASGSSETESAPQASDDAGKNGNTEGPSEPPLIEI